MIIPPFWTASWTDALITHLWQSTAVGLLAWLLTAGLRHNAARVRYSIWLAASIKFLAPLTLLTSLGSLWGAPTSGDRPGRSVLMVIEEFSRPLSQAQVQLPRVAPSSHLNQILGALIGLAWLLGATVMAANWIRSWRNAGRLVKCACPFTEGREFDALQMAIGDAAVRTPIRLMLSEQAIEPGIFGVFRPVLLWPSGLSDQLTRAQVEAIMAHEVEHVARRDNLTAALHALVEAVFWFHPLVRWMSSRLNEERERACDETVMARNTPPEAYAQSILKVCAFSVAPPYPCVSGVSGADLKDRLRRIMSRRPASALNPARKMMLAAAGMLVFAAPVGIGVLHSQPRAVIQSDVSPASLPKYDVAVIKPSSSDDGRRMMMMTPGGVRMEGVEIEMLLEQAFGVEKDRILSAPSWVRSNRYDMEAKVPPEEAPRMDKLTSDQRRAMLLPLLEERLKLKYHHESRELPIYSLVVAKGGPKLAEAKPAELPPPAPAGAPAPQADASPKDRIGNRNMMRMGPGDIQAQGGGMTFLAHALSGLVGRTVLDKTGLSGAYDFSLKWTPDETGPMAHAGPEGGPPRGDMAGEQGGPSLFTALEEQLGLKLETQKGMVDVIVIDHLDLPSAN